MPSLSSVADFFRQPHMTPGGDPELLTRTGLKGPPSGVPPGMPVPLPVPPIVNGLYRMISPTPAETGELPPRYWPHTGFTIGVPPSTPSSKSVLDYLYPTGNDYGQ